MIKFLLDLVIEALAAMIGRVPGAGRLRAPEGNRARRLATVSARLSRTVTGPILGGFAGFGLAVVLALLNVWNVGHPEGFTLCFFAAILTVPMGAVFGAALYAKLGANQDGGTGSTTDGDLKRALGDDTGLVEELASRGSDAVPDLIELLSHKKGAVRMEARQILENLTGKDFGLSPQAWSAWHNRRSPQRG